MTQENLLILHAFIYGAAFSFLYDCIRCVRRLFPHGSFEVAAENFLFWAYCSVKVFRLLHREGNGLLRWYAILVAAIGIWLYVKLISPFFLKAMVALLRPVVKIAGGAVKAACKKVRRFLKMLLTGLGKIIKMICKGVIKHGGKLWISGRKIPEENGKKPKKARHKKGLIKKGLIKKGLIKKGLISKEGTK